MKMPLFDGATYEPEHDRARLSSQLAAVREIMRDGQWRTLKEIALDQRVKGSEAGVSARLRDLRKPRFGGHIILRQRIGPGRGTFMYKMLPRDVRP